MARDAKTPTATAATMTEVPDGTRPEEFLTDQDLVGFYDRKLAAMDADDPDRDAVVEARRGARRSAAAAAAAIAELAAMDADEALYAAADQETPA